jgi:hypothetical protein
MDQKKKAFITELEAKTMNVAKLHATEIDKYKRELQQSSATYQTTIKG